MQVVADECVRRAWQRYLRDAGHEIAAWATVAGCQGSPDDALLAWAAERDVVVLTADNDLGQIVWARRWLRPTVLQLEDPAWRPEDCGIAVLTALAECHSRPAERFFIAIRPDRTYRLRPLPLR